MKNSLFEWEDEYVQVQDAGGSSFPMRSGDPIPKLPAYPSVLDFIDYREYASGSGFLSDFGSAFYNQGYGDIWQEFDLQR